MLSISSLRNAINQQLTNADSKRRLIESLMTSASQHDARGDYANAKRDRDSVERYMRDLHDIENTIAEYESEIQKRQHKASDIDKRINDLEQHFKHDLERLEKEKGSVAGANILTAPEAEIIRRELKAKGIDKQIVELKKHFDHEINNLKNERDILI